ncbi:DUF4176 domain-containing protein [Halalkalibacter hemicellulosilyticus]|uniref:Putative EsaC protein analog n=1 Tax=Halalkalibacter hemicellulosilyticusJCM 9152 TaxID=1236971 RepID=W4QKA5_9BACI|nr:DUF4176 domain-containing protein [Halalkalibacter hemicellulosilyticus]GAE32068.1 putative EsaC protein analog [Halalkalibacter hemicellulosilyticusJCM 9152]
MLPIGSIVYLKEGTSKLMILNRGPIIEENGENKMFDYSGCFYPQGLVPDKVFYFNQENIDEVVFEGFQDEEEKRFQTLFKDWKEENKNNFVEGKVDGPLAK